MASEGKAERPQLVADIGGTNARFALHLNGVIDREVVLPSADYPHVSLAIEDYLRRMGLTNNSQRPRQASIAIACPVNGDHIRMTNYTWEFSASALRRTLAFDQLILLNDFTALAMSIPYLPASELKQVGGGASAPGPLALIGPGTGLGVSGLIRSGDHWLPLQGEGGHASFSPADESELAILKVLWKQYSHVSAERLLSGQGMVSLYEALCELRNQPAEALSPAQISHRGLGGDPLCREVLSKFCAMLGTVAGNLVLTLGALGGLYIGGGIMPKMEAFFLQSQFRERFEAKGRYVDYLKAVPVWLITSDASALIGAAHAFTDPGPRWVAA